MKETSKKVKCWWIDLWKEKAFKIALIAALVTVIGGIVAVVIAFLLPRCIPEKPFPKPPLKKPAAEVNYDASDNPLIEVIREVEGETDYDIIATKEAEEFRVSGNFQGDNWLHILKKIFKTYDKELDFKIDEKNKKIAIGLRKPEKTKK